MPELITVVDNVAKVSAAQPTDSIELNKTGNFLEETFFATVELQSGDAFRVDRADRRSAVWLSLLNERVETGESVYLEVEPETKIIQKLLLPQLLMVTEIDETPEAERHFVRLRISHARHFVRTSNPNYERLIGDLREARMKNEPVLITETLAEHEIVDVRPDPNPNKGVAHDLLALETAPDEKEESFFNLVSDMSGAESLELFRYLAGQTQIPFNYPDDGCWGRAHEMRRLIIGRNYECRKIWIYGRLRVRTSNSPKCEVPWDWHVAPIIRVRSGEGVIEQVVDPSLFDNPVSIDAWKGIQSDAGARLHRTDSNVFYRDVSGSLDYDSNYSKTNEVLRRFSRLRNLRFAELGLPPYRCP